jgi:predicted 3-demethylubiquinone-9 3-methyltransferase (glyoxalase superfamily)
MAKTIRRIAPCLWFDHQAEDAARFYVAIFRNSKIGSISRYDKHAARAAGRPEGSVLTVTFELDGQEFMALKGGPVFQFSEAISFVVNCETQDEVDHFWARLSAGGQEVQCGWLKDRFALMTPRAAAVRRARAAARAKATNARHACWPDAPAGARRRDAARREASAGRRR